MPDIKDSVGIREKINIVLRGPDGKIKDERKPDEKARKQRREYRDETKKQNAD